MGCSHGRRHTCSSSNEHRGGGCGIGTIAAAIAATSGDGAGRDGDDRPARGGQGRAQGGLRTPTQGQRTTMHVSEFAWSFYILLL
jgi:hypothetical protein